MRTGIGWLGLMDRRPFAEMARQGGIQRPVAYRFGRPPVSDAEWLKCIAHDDARVLLGLAKSRRSKTSIAMERARLLPDDRPELAEAARRRAHRKLTSQQRDFRAAVIILVRYWETANLQQRAWALAKIADRAIADGAQQVSLTCAGLLGNPSLFESDRHSPPGTDPAIRSGLTLPLGFVAHWASQKAFD